MGLILINISPSNISQELLWLKGYHESGQISSELWMLERSLIVRGFPPVTVESVKEETAVKVKQAGFRVNTGADNQIPLHARL